MTLHRQVNEVPYFNPGLRDNASLNFNWDQFSFAVCILIARQGLCTHLLTSDFPARDLCIQFSVIVCNVLKMNQYDNLKFCCFCYTKCNKKGILFQIHCVFHVSTFSKRHRISFIYSINIVWSVYHDPELWKFDFEAHKSIVESHCLTQTSNNSKYFLWSHRLRVNEFQL